MLVVLLILAGLVLPKLSVLALHLHPDITTVVICTGSEMVTISIGADGTPIETGETDQSPCLVSDGKLKQASAWVTWTMAPRSYRHGFVEKPFARPSQSELGLLPDPRGRPRLV